MPDGKSYWRARWQTWDATFGVDTNAVTLSQVAKSGRTHTQTYTAAPVASFHDASPTAYYNSAIPYNSVKTAGSGLKIDITSVSDDRGSYRCTSTNRGASSATGDEEGRPRVVQVR